MPDLSRPRLVLASTSRYRQELLARLGIPFETTAPAIDESPADGESPQALALRLACAKAYAAQSTFPESLIIGCDQVAVAGEMLLNKPVTHARAVEQLRRISGKPVAFFTALCLLNARTARNQTAVVPVTVHMRKLGLQQIERYLRAEPAYDCAGSARFEGLGITLVARFEGEDPTALIGMPLIRLCDMLKREGVELP